MNMEAKDYVTDSDIREVLDEWGWKLNADEGRLMLAELMLKSSSSYYNSHTEEGFLTSFNLLKKDRTPNKVGFRFLCSMFYNHSNLRPVAYELMKNYRLG